MNLNLKIRANFHTLTACNRQQYINDQTSKDMAYQSGQYLELEEELMQINKRKNIKTCVSGIRDFSELEEEKISKFVLC